MAGKGRRPEDRAFEPRPFIDDRADCLLVGVAVAPQRLGRRLERSPHHHRASIVERMAEHRGRLQPFESMRREGQRPPEWRRDAERMNRRADVVREAGQRQFGGPRAAADGMVGFEDDDLASGLGQHDRRTQSVGPRTDDDGINHQCDGTGTRGSGLGARD
jgi:hypothetical protein